MVRLTADKLRAICCRAKLAGFLSTNPPGNEKSATHAALAIVPLSDTLRTMRHVRHWCARLGLCLLLSGSPDLLSAEKPADNSLLTVERIFGKEEFKTQDWGPARWLKDGSGYTTLEKSEAIKEARDIVRCDPESGRREVVVFASKSSGPW